MVAKPECNVNSGNVCQPARAAVILAGGNGTRFRELSRKIAGHDLPKQFCRVIGEKTLLGQTRTRVSLSIPAELTLAVVTRAHERFFVPLLADMPAQNVVVQPDNRGTAPAILYSLLRLAELTPNASVAIFPCDHYVSDDEAFMRHVESAFCAVATRPELAVLLGIAADSPEVEYGWIEPASPLDLDGLPMFSVCRFWKKPSAETASLLLRHGCFWNSLVMVAQLSTLLGLFMSALPGMYLSFAAVRPVLGTLFEQKTMEALYQDLESVNFSDRVLEKYPASLAVLPVTGVEWRDLGEPERILALLSRLALRPNWLRPGNRSTPSPRTSARGY